MANAEYLARLKEGADAWNAWRKARPMITRPDLALADLRAADLTGADLHSVDLTSALLGDAHLNHANLTGAVLREVSLTYARLNDALLTRANLISATLSGATLSGANLSGANLISATLSGATLSGANLTGAHMGYTTLTGLDLGQVRGLEDVKHEFPSSIGIDTIYRSRGQIPEAFLRGAGVPDQFIIYMRSLTAENAIEYYSAFISYSSKDEDFAHRLYNDLQANNVRCWFAPEDMKIGDKFWEHIDASIRIYDKLLVILSAHSVDSAWVEHEVMAALEREHQSPGRTVLFPVRLDDTVMTASQPWASSLRRERHIGNFCAWKEHHAYQQAFIRLLRDLKAESR